MSSLEDLGRKIGVEKNKKRRKNEKDLKLKKSWKKWGKKKAIWGPKKCT
jgi:hypothetical protein